MSRKKKDLVGLRFGLLTVIEDLGYNLIGKSQQKQRVFKCRCDCGNEVVVSYIALVNGFSKSCGCLRNKNCGRPKGSKKMLNGNEYSYSTIDNEKVVCVKASNCDDIILVDPEDWDMAKSYTWHITKYGYAAANVDGKFKIMQSFLIPDIPKGYERDHINRNRLDNRRCNLRVVTKFENLMNREYQNKTSNHVGVCWYKPTGQWLAYIGHEGNITNLGLFDNEDDAIAVRKQAENDFWDNVA